MSLNMDEFKKERDKAYDLLLKTRELSVLYEIKLLIGSKRDTKTGQLHKLTLDDLEKEIDLKIKKLKDE